MMAEKSANGRLADQEVAEACAELENFWITGKKALRRGVRRGVAAIDGLGAADFLMSRSA